ncbi:MAG: IscA/HesB family protein [Pseudomonadota bacterium]
MLEVTTKAQEQLGSYMKSNSLESPIRVYLAEGGCSGSSLALALDEARDGDAKYEAGDLTFVMEQGLKDSAGEVKVDYVEMNGRSGFLVSSQNSVSCGGSSSCGGSCCC